MLFPRPFKKGLVLVLTGLVLLTLVVLISLAHLSPNRAALHTKTLGISSQNAGSFSSYTSAVLADHPSAYYHLDETSATKAIDASSNHYDARYQGSVNGQGQPTGIFGSDSDAAVGLAGDNGYLTTANQGTPLVATTGNHDRTVELWFNTFQAYNQTLFETGGAGHASNFDIALVGAGGPGGCGSQASAGLYVRFWDDDLHLAGLHLADAHWHYVVVTVSNSGNTVNVLVDGKQPAGYMWNGSCYTSSAQTQPFSMPYAVNTFANPIGLGNSDWANGFIGSMDEVAIYPTALTATQVANHFAAASSPPPSMPTSLSFSVNCTSTGQLCDPPYKTTVQTGSSLQIEYDVPPAHCSSIRLHIFLDGNEVTTTQFLGWQGGPPSLPLSTGMLDLGPVVPGTHVLDLQAEGQVGGCNSGQLYSWHGTLSIYTTTGTGQPPGTPAITGVTPGNGSVSIQWQPVNDRVTVDNYQIRFLKSTTISGTLPGNTTNQTILNLNNCQQYQFQVRAGNANGYSSWSSPSKVVVPFVHVTDPPTLVAIIVNGVQTANPNDTFSPVATSNSNHKSVSAYCFHTGSSTTSFPVSLAGALGGWNGQLNPPYAQGQASLTDRLAANGAVILPYGYRGASLTKDAVTGTPVFQINASTSSDSDNQSPLVDANYLHQEIASIHRVWNNAQIVVFAESGGGVPALEYWEHFWHFNHEGVSNIFTFDSPINGFQLARICQVAEFCHMGPNLANFYAELWRDQDSIDPQLISADTDGSFRPIGTEGDYAMDAGDTGVAVRSGPTSAGLLSQLLFQCQGWPLQTCNSAFPDALSSCPGTQYIGTASYELSHEVVKVCPGVVDYVAGVLGLPGLKRQLEAVFQIKVKTPGVRPPKSNRQ